MFQWLIRAAYMAAAIDLSRSTGQLPNLTRTLRSSALNFAAIF
jgi:hypothetical protein